MLGKAPLDMNKATANRGGRIRSGRSRARLTGPNRQWGRGHPAIDRFFSYGQVLVDSRPHHPHSVAMARLTCAGRVKTAGGAMRRARPERPLNAQSVASPVGADCSGGGGCGHRAGPRWWLPNVRGRSVRPAGASPHRLGRPLRVRSDLPAGGRGRLVAGPDSPEGMMSIIRRTLGPCGVGSRNCPAQRRLVREGTDH